MLLTVVAIVRTICIGYWNVYRNTYTTHAPLRRGGVNSAYTCGAQRRGKPMPQQAVTPSKQAVTPSKDNHSSPSPASSGPGARRGPGAVEAVRGVGIVGSGEVSTSRPSEGGQDGRGGRGGGGSGGDGGDGAGRGGETLPRTAHARAPVHWMYTGVWQ
jgi:hypothetical protein